MTELSGRFLLTDLIEAALLPGSICYFTLAHPKVPTGSEFQPRVVELFGKFPNGVGCQQVAMELRAVIGVRVADETVLGRCADGFEARHPSRDRLPQIQLVQGSRRRGVRERVRLRLLRGRSVVEDGRRRHRVQVLVRQGPPRSGLRLWEQGDRGALRLGEPDPGAAGGDDGDARACTSGMVFLSSASVPSRQQWRRNGTRCVSGSGADFLISLGRATICFFRDGEVCGHFPARSSATVLHLGIQPTVQTYSAWHGAAHSF